ncbi:hypothetical protein [Amycolatopsis sp. NPDC051102]|uniref:hypothetical protein n=1 Tax=Amycolatopsis sp. NPDC051102 TaxID=3155163 RepID=UPI00341B48F4
MSRAEQLSSLQLQLLTLANRGGVLRKDLPKLLTCELDDLRRSWKLHVGADLDKIRKTDLGKLQEEIRNRLRQHLEKMLAQGVVSEHRPADVDIFRLSFNYSFNIDVPPPYWSRPKLERQGHVRNFAKGGRGTSPRAVQRKLERACEAIAEQMLATDEFTANVPVSLLKKVADRDEQAPAEEDSSNAPDEPTAAPEAKPFWRRRRVLFGALGVTVALLVAAGVMIASRGETPLDPQSLLRATVLATGTDSAYGGIFPTQLSAKADSYVDKLSKAPNDADYERIFQGELSDGAYAAGGIRVNIALEVLVDGEISLYDIKPVNVKREAIPLDTLVLLSLGHGPAAKVQVSLDQAVPVAMDIGSGQPQRFGASEMMGLSKASKGIIDAAFTAQSVAETFDIELSYEYQGKQYTQVLHRTPDGEPFRAAALLCKDRLQAPAPEVSAAELERLRTLRYRRVVGLDSTIDAAGNYAVKNIDPNDFAGRCY